MLYRMEMVPEPREAKNEGLAMTFVKYFYTFSNAYAKDRGLGDQKPQK